MFLFVCLIYEEKKVRKEGVGTKTNFKPAVLLQEGPLRR